MSKYKKESFFWTSYSDLMTSIFFVMLVLFILSITLLHRKILTTQAQIEKIKEIEEAVNNIDSTYFDYNIIHKKHIMKIKVNFPRGESDINTLDSHTQDDLIRAGISIQNTLLKISQEYPKIQYLLIIEGQASKDRYTRNYELSYERALALRRLWGDIDFGNNCEVLISGSGIGGSLRENQEHLNQRFLIHIVPKTGVIEESKSN